MKCKEGNTKAKMYLKHFRITCDVSSSSSDLDTWNFWSFDVASFTIKITITS